MKFYLPMAALLAGSPAVANVVNLTPNTFISHNVVELPIPPQRAYARFMQIGDWWNANHSYSGKLSNLSLDQEAGGCFCEKLPNGGSVEHMRVSLVQPGKRLVLTGGLGPLLFQGISGTMDVTFEPTKRGTLVTMDYRVAGFAYSNAEKLAAPVDKVLFEQIKRFEASAQK